MATLYKPNAFLTRPGRASVAVEAETKTKPAPDKKQAAEAKPKTKPAPDTKQAAEAETKTKPAPDKKQAAASKEGKKQ